MMAVFSPALMRLFGREFAAGDTTLSILALMMLYVTATGNNVVVLVMSGRSRTSLWIAAVTLALNVGANLVLIPIFGIDGAALAWAVSLLVSNVLINGVLYRRFLLHPFGPAFLPIVCLSLGAIALPAAVLRVALGPHWDAFFLTALLGGPIYAFFLWRIRHRLEIHTLVGARPS